MVNDAIFHKLMVLFTSEHFLCLGIPLIGLLFIPPLHPEYFASYNGTMLSRIQLSCSSIVKILVLVFMDFQFMTNDCLICSFHTVSHFTGELLPQSSSPLQLYMRL